MKDDFQESMESMEAVADQPLSDYETERDKPMPTTLHGLIEGNLLFELRTILGSKFRIATEVTLDTKPRGSTPDVLVLPPGELDFKNDPPRRSAPVLTAIEIVSASQSLDLFFEKAIMYFEFGVKSFWVVVPKMRAVLVFNRPEHPDKYQFFNEGAFIEDKTIGVKLAVDKVFA